MAILSLFFIFLAPDLGAATTEESLAKINRLPPAERQAALVKEAKNEKMVVWYAPMNREDLRQFTTGFEAEYPFLKVEVLTSGPQSLLNRILTEHRAGKYNYDTLNIRETPASRTSMRWRCIRQAKAMRRSQIWKKRSGHIPTTAISSKP